MIQNNTLWFSQTQNVFHRFDVRVIFTKYVAQNKQNMMLDFSELNFMNMKDSTVWIMLAYSWKCFWAEFSMFILRLIRVIKFYNMFELFVVLTINYTTIVALVTSIWLSDFAESCEFFDICRKVMSENRFWNRYALSLLQMQKAIDEKMLSCLFWSTSRTVDSNILSCSNTLSELGWHTFPLYFDSLFATFFFSNSLQILAGSGAYFVLLSIPCFYFKKVIWSLQKINASVAERERECFWYTRLT